MRRIFFALALACAGCAAPAGSPEATSTYLYPDLGSFHRAVTTASPLAQRYVDQGFTLLWAFNHDEAIRSFEAAARLDPECAMAWWGIAIANGPHINNAAVDEDHARAAWSALERARRARGASATERELVTALGQRYSSDPRAERPPLEAAYADAMRNVWRAHLQDSDVGAWFAEAAMDQHPWDLWTHAGEPKPWTEEIVRTLEAVLALKPDHVGACHLYIHAMEASREPERALAAADRLRALVPGAGHLVHMPAHIDLRLGHYAEASEANVRAIAADAAHRKLFPAAGFYHVYLAHNHHFLSFSSMMEGASARALDSSRALVAGMPPEFVNAMGPMIDGFLPTDLHVLVRFGRWREILAAPDFSGELVLARSIRHYARGVAFAALGRLAEARAEQAALDAVAEKIDASRVFGNNPGRAVAEIAQLMLAGEIAFREGNTDEGVRLLREAAKGEDELVYDEPPDWMMPVRHALGAALVQAKRFEEAEQVYREDLARFPENGWSLFGLSQSLRARGSPDVALVQERFRKAWSRADVELKSSCFCQPGL
jgi:tetratricopeptide (TPR) repeat protein